MENGERESGEKSQQSFLHVAWRGGKKKKKKKRKEEKCLYVAYHLLNDQNSRQSGEIKPCFLVTYRLSDAFNSECEKEAFLPPAGKATRRR